MSKSQHPNEASSKVQSQLTFPINVYLRAKSEEKRRMKNVLGTELKACSYDPMTGVFRDGFCKYAEQDNGLHIVAAKVTEGFLEWNKARGNDLVTPKPQWSFPGLKPGDWWCVCMGVWLKSKEAGHPLYLKLEACHEKMLEYVSMETLKEWEYQD